MLRLERGKGCKARPIVTEVRTPCHDLAERLVRTTNHGGVSSPTHNCWAVSSTLATSPLVSLLMMPSERGVCTIGVKTRTFVFTSGADHPVDSRNDRAALHYPDHGSRRRSRATKRVVTRCENSTARIPDWSCVLSIRRPLPTTRIISRRCLRTSTRHRHHQKRP